MEANETIARFVRSSSWVAKSKGRIKYPAFLPAPDNDTSVFRTKDLLGEALWKIACDEVGPCHGAALVVVAVVRENRLDVVAHEPPLRHANIRGWPQMQDPELQKSKRQERAIAIAESASFKPWPK